MLGLQFSSRSLLLLQPLIFSNVFKLPAVSFASPEMGTPAFGFSDSWKVLGPFQIGTREATWGADPLEYFGGFSSLSCGPDAEFRSSLPTNGTAAWNFTRATQVSDTAVSSNVSLSIRYSNVDWDFLKVVYGWAAVQYQAWARGQLLIYGNKTQPVILYTDGVLEFNIDGVHYFGGDFYSFRKAPPVLHLAPGSHNIEIRLVRDVRAFGGILEPTIDVVLGVQQATGTLELAKPGILTSDVVDGKLASTQGAVYLRNSGQEDIMVQSIRSVNVSPIISFAGEENGDQAVFDSPLSSKTDFTKQTTNETKVDVALVAGQTRSVPFSISLPYHNASSVEYEVTYKTLNGKYQARLRVTQDLKHVLLYRTHKITFLHPGGMASYAMLRPPSQNAACPSNQTKAPVLLMLHGAGVEADNPEVTSALDPVSDLCAWVLFPTGVTAWSADDWHNWGFSDVEAAIQAIPTWIEQVHWKGPGVDIDRWIVSGHSNGGQGTWYATTHRPDKVLAAAPVSGYASIQKYVPYELWQPADPRRTAIVSASLNSYRHEMLMANTRGIPIQQQHGEIDDNVPAYHSRFLAQQIALAGSDSNYFEVPGQNHWWQTVMTTSELVKFYYAQTANQEPLPRKLQDFSIVIGDPGDMGSKGGIKVLHLIEPGQYGRVEVTGRTIKTLNVQSLEFDPLLWTQSILIDGKDIALSTTCSNNASLLLSRGPNHVWELQNDITTWSLGKRSGRQLGSMTAFLRTQGPFHVQHSGSKSTSQLALQVSRNLHQYFQADSVISSILGNQTKPSKGNVVTLILSPASLDYSDFPIRVGKTCSVRDYHGQKQDYGARARGAAYIRPLEDERLELVVWGADEDGLRQAARIVPMITGVGQPDFVVFGESAKWRGIEGVLAMGFFDHQWQVTASSVVETGGG